MLYSLQKILELGEKEKFCVPAFNVYNMETVMGVIKASEEMKSPVIMQFYSRLATTGFADYLCPIILKAAEKSSVPVCLHLDHGAGIVPATIAVKNGTTGIMVDYSSLPYEENILATKKVADICKQIGIGVEGELGHIGKAANGDENEYSQYTKVDEAKKYIEETGVSALAIMVGTAHGRYKKAPKIAIDRIREIKEACNIPLVLHGGSGVPDDQIKEAIKAGIRKMNFGTDLCYSFLDTVRNTDKNKVAIDLFMEEPIEAVSNFAKSKITVLGSAGRV